MKKTLSIFIVLFGFVSLVQAQSSHYYGINSLTPLVEEVSGGKTCRDITLFGGVQIQDCTVGDKATTAYLLPNHLKSSQVLVDSSKAIISNCLYSPYGEISAEISDSDKKNCKYTGTYDWESETQTFQSPTRRHEPSSQRFLSLDPNRQTFSPYTAVMGNPVNKLDLNGLQPRDYDLAGMSRTFDNPYVPGSFTIDADSLATFRQIKVGNAFVSIMDKSTGRIYMNPVTRRFVRGEKQFWTGTEFEGVARLNGAPTAPIEHGDGGLPAHQHLLRKIVAMENPALEGDALTSRVISARENYVGFSFRHEEGHRIQLIPRSRSLNNSKFKGWTDGGSKAEAESLLQNHLDGEVYRADFFAEAFMKHYNELRTAHPGVYKGIKGMKDINNRVTSKILELYGDPNGIAHSTSHGIPHLWGKKLRRLTRIQQNIPESRLMDRITTGTLPKYYGQTLTDHLNPFVKQFSEEGLMLGDF